MPRLKATKAAELEAFWRAHLANWRAKFRHENAGREGKLLYRRAGGLEHRLKWL